MLPLDIFVVRHCESEGNLALRKIEEANHSSLSPEFLSRYAVHCRLTNKGRAQCPVVGEWLKEWLKEKKLPHFDRHFVSTHVRTLETAALLGLPDAAWEMDFQLRERRTGIWGSIPDQIWQERYDRSVRLKQNHRFYTPMPDGESIEYAGIRTRPFISALDRDDRNQERNVVVAHGDVMQAIRVNFEGITPDEYHKRSEENLPDFRIGNGQILHYTRVDPTDSNSTHYDRFRWVRSVNPWCSEYAGHDWRVIEQRRYSNEELLAMAESFPPLLPD